MRAAFRPGLRAAACGALLSAASLVAAVTPVAAPLELERLTTTELVQRIAGGATTVLVPIGGTEQSGPAIVLGKHNARARALALRIAERLEQTLVAPVIAYVPEGSVDPPTGHLRHAGTIGIPVAAFEATLEGAAESLALAGFRDIVLLGDHGGYQSSLQRVADRVNAAWRRKGRGGGQPPRVHALGEYYEAASRGFADRLAAQGYARREIGEHAGLADAALSLALDPSGVRVGRGADGRPQVSAQPDRDGASGDPRRATGVLGEAGVQLVVDRSVAALRQRLAR